MAHTDQTAYANGMKTAAKTSSFDKTAPFEKTFPFENTAPFEKAEHSDNAPDLDIEAAACAPTYAMAFLNSLPKGILPKRLSIRQKEIVAAHLDALDQGTRHMGAVHQHTGAAGSTPIGTSTEHHLALGAIVGDAKAFELLSLWTRHQTREQVRGQVNDKGLSPWLSDGIIDAMVTCYGEESLSIIERSPYRMLGLLDWSKVDGMARHLGVPRNDRARLQAAFEAALHLRLDDGGHTWSDTTTLLALVVKLLGTAGDTTDTIQTSTTTIITSKQRDAQNPSTQSQDLQWADDHLHALATAGHIVHHKGGWQTGGCWQMEQDILNATKAKARERLIPAPSAEQREASITAAIEAADTHSQEGLGHPLGSSQKDAVGMALTHRFGMVAGYAGSGKTTALRAIAHALRAQGQTLHVLALSARAAKRAGDAAGIDGQSGQTIAGFLKRLSLGALSLDEGCTVVIDEASMLDLTSLWRIVRKLNGAGLLLVGDPGQLPPIGFGLTLHALLEQPDLPSVHLDTVYRQDTSTGIPQVANLVRTGDVPDLPQWVLGATGVSFYPCRPDEVVDVLKTIGRDLQHQGIAPDDIQILSPIKQGPAGVLHINQTLHTQKQRHTNAPLLPGRSDIAVGDPVVWTKNNQERGLWNGSLGRILETDDRHTLASFDGVTYDLLHRDTQDLDLAYALSVHRAQGSQWHTVLLPVFPSRIMSRALLYTAITRATHNVVLIGQRPERHLDNNPIPQTGTMFKKC
jgi:exodeoxyribonuclease V alpha subunit